MEAIIKTILERTYAAESSEWLLQQKVFLQAAEIERLKAVILRQAMKKRGGKRLKTAGVLDMVVSHNVRGGFGISKGTY